MRVLRSISFFFFNNPVSETVLLLHGVKVPHWLRLHSHQKRKVGEKSLEHL